MSLKVTLSALATFAVASASFAVALPYSTSFETSEGWNAAPFNYSGGSIANGWSPGNRWKTNSLAFSGSQSLQYTYTGAANTLPNSTTQGPNIDAAFKTQPHIVRTKMYVGSLAAGQGDTAVTGLAGRLEHNLGTLFSFTVQGNGQVNRRTGFGSFSSLGTISNFKDKWLDLVLTLDSSTGQGGAYTFDILDGATSLHSSSGVLLATSPITTAGVTWYGFIGSNNGGAGADIYSNTRFDNFSVEVVPEPATLAVLAGLALAAARKRRA